MSLRLAKRSETQTMSEQPLPAGTTLLLKGGQVGPPDVLRRFAGQAAHH